MWVAQAEVLTSKLTGGEESAPVWPSQDTPARIRVAEGQAPTAAVLSCADSRVPPEILFDQGLGDLFVNRVAGNIASEEMIASLEYGVAVLKIPLIMVLSHERCGAVKEAVDHAAHPGTKAPGHIGSLLDAIAPAVTQSKGMAGDAVDNAVRANAKLVVKQLSASQPIVGKAVTDGKVKIVAARYDLDHGKVELLT